MAELSEHVNILHDVNLTLYTVTGIHHKGGVLLKVIKLNRITKRARNSLSKKLWNKVEGEKRFKGQKKFIPNKLYSVLNILH